MTFTTVLWVYFLSQKKEVQKIAWNDFNLYQTKYIQAIKMKKKNYVLHTFIKAEVSIIVSLFIT